MNTGTPSMRTFESKAQSLIKGPIANFGPNDAVFYEVTPVYKDANSTIGGRHDERDHPTGERDNRGTVP